MAAILEGLFSKNLKLLYAIIILTYSMGTISFRGSFFHVLLSYKRQPSSGTKWFWRKFYFILLFLSTAAILDSKPASFIMLQPCRLIMLQLKFEIWAMWF